MINVLCVCGNGMGTSTITKINVKKICVNHNIDANLESCSFGEALSFLPTTDIVISTPEWVSTLPPGNYEKIVVKNIFDNETIDKFLVQLMKDNFPDENCE